MNPIRCFFTGKDNQSWEILRVYFALFGMFGIVYQGFACIAQGQHFSIGEFLGAAGAYILGAGVGIRQKDQGSGGQS